MNLFGPEWLANPYPFYHSLRALDPVHWEPGVGAWVLTRYQDVVTVLRDPRMSAERLGVLEDFKSGTLVQVDPLFGTLAHQMLFADPPRHTRLRGLVNKAFTPRAVERMRPLIRARVEGYLDAVAASGRMDAIRDLAKPLPLTVIVEMLGLPDAEQAPLVRWSEEFAAVLGNLNISPAQMERGLQSAVQFREYFRAAADRARRPGEGLLADLAAAEEAGDRLDEEELLANAILLLVAGHETTTNLIGNGLLALLRHPEQLQALRNDPSLVPNAIEELLRYDSPVQFTDRIAREDITVAGKPVRRGDYLILVLGAANRDPAEFPDPDRLDVTRPDPRHVAFAHGPHFCLGAPLARLEGQVALEAILRRFPRLALADPSPAYRANFNLRGLKSLPLVLY